jgi:hypothetical protein
MGDVIEYVEFECGSWVEQYNSLKEEGFTQKEILEQIGEPYLPDCWEYVD